MDAVVLARDLHGIERPSALQLTFDIETELIERALQAASQLLLQGAGLGAEATAVALELTRKLSGTEIDQGVIAHAITQVTEERA